MELNLLKTLNDGTLSDYFKEKHGDKFIFCSNVLYQYNGVYWEKDDKLKSNLHKFIDKTFYNELCDIFNEFKKETKDVDFKLNQSHFSNIEALRKTKSRKLFVDEICIKLSNNNIKWNENENLFAFTNKIFDLNKNKFIKSKPNQYINKNFVY